jgi:hypothetical protein
MPHKTATEDSKSTKSRRAKVRRRFSISEPPESDGPQIYKSDLDAMTPEQRKAHWRRMRPRWKQACALVLRQADAEREARAAHRAAAAGRQVERRRGGGRPAVRPSRHDNRGSPDDDSSGEPEPPRRAGRLCECDCGESIDHLCSRARYLNGTHRLRAMRARDRARERDDLAIDAPPQPGTYTVHTTAELEALKKRIEGGCRCNGHHIAAGRGDEPSPRCIKCGHRRGPLTHDWTSADKLKSRPVVIHKVAVRRKPPRYGDRKRKPVTHKPLLPSGEVVPV